MTGHHGHRLEESRVRAGGAPRTLLMVFLALVGVATVAGVWRLWPAEADLPDVPAGAAFAAPGVTFPRGDVTDVQPACKLESQVAPDGTPDRGYQPSDTCGHMTVRLDQAEGGKE